MNILKCAYCGAVLTVHSGKKAVLCEYCDGVNIINQIPQEVSSIDNNHKAESIYSEKDQQQTSYKAEKLLADETYNVKYQVSENYWVEGVLLLSLKEICFIPDKKYRNKSAFYYKFLSLYYNVDKEDLFDLKYLKIADISRFFSVYIKKSLQRQFMRPEYNYKRSELIRSDRFKISLNFFIRENWDAFEKSLNSRIEESKLIAAKEEEYSVNQRVFKKRKNMTIIAVIVTIIGGFIYFTFPIWFKILILYLRSL